MRKLEEQYGNRIAVVGIHSGKYTAERVTANIRDAALRLDAVHPTLNDRQFRVWRSYAVQAWPTLVAIDPRGYVVGQHAGEFDAESLAPFIQNVLAGVSPTGTPAPHSAELEPDAPSHTPGELRFPGKVALRGTQFAISDSGNHRVLVGTLQGTEMRVVREIPVFVNPQGLAFGDDHLFVADPGAHSITEITLANGLTRVVAGIGRQARTQRDLDAGALSSPWDLVLDGSSLIVAMAGIHQLWKVDVQTGAGAPFSGSGAEELHDGPHATAALAQPMGIAMHDGAVVFCDSESSAIRRADNNLSGSVSTIVGTGLFDFGDVDGVGDEVRLQHPQGITRLADGRILIADSYNGALKWIDPASRRAETWIRDLEEPAGLAAGSSHVYIAETNAHRVLAVQLADGVRTLLTLRF